MEENKSLLTPQCGHHCGVQMTGTHQYVGHCDCDDCHKGVMKLMGNTIPKRGIKPKPDPKESISE